MTANQANIPHPARRFVVACGATGGHVMPGLATAHRLRERGHAVELWLAGRAIETHSATDWDGPVMPIGARPIPWRKPLSALSGIGSQLCALKQLCAHLRQSRPDALLAMGSYASLAPVLAARMSAVPVVLHESNAVPGRAIVALSRLARVTALAFEDAAAHLPGRTTRWTGMPIRRDLADRPPLEDIPQNAFTLLVMGGSQGARALNLLVLKALEGLPPAEALGLFVVHLTGAHDADAIRQRYREKGIPAHVFEFLSDIGRAYAAADIAVCRSGAATCAELCMLGLPSLLVPLPTAIRDHQTANARALAQIGGAEYFPQASLTPERLRENLLVFRHDLSKRAAMRQALLAHARPGAEDRLAILLEHIAERTP